MATGSDRPVFRQALRGMLLMAALTAVICAVGLAMAALFVVVMT